MFGLYPNSYKEIISIFHKNKNIEKVVIYGSRAKGNYKEGSDIDLALFGNVKQEDIIQFLHEFEESLIPYKIDLLIFSQLQSELLIDHIERVGQTFYEKESSSNQYFKK